MSVIVMVSCGAFRANVLSAATARSRRASASGSRTLSAVLRTESNRTTGTRVARNACSRDRQPESTAPSRPAPTRLVVQLGTRITAPRERTRTDRGFSQGYPWSVAQCHGRRSEAITDERARRGSEKQHVGEDRKSVVVGKECRCRWAPYPEKKKERTGRQWRSRTEVQDRALEVLRC